MRIALLTLAVTLSAAPAFAGGITIDLPNLTWPTGDVTTSTKDCPTATVPCR